MCKLSAISFPHHFHRKDLEDTLFKKAVKTQYEVMLPDISRTTWKAFRYWPQQFRQGGRCHHWFFISYYWDECPISVYQMEGFQRHKSQGDNWQGWDGHMTRKQQELVTTQDIFIFLYPCYRPNIYAVPKIVLNIFSPNNTFYVCGQKDNLNSQWSGLASDSSPQTRLRHISETAWLTGLVGSLEGRPTTLNEISIVNFPPNRLQTNKPTAISRVTILRRKENISPWKVTFCLWSVANFQNTGWSTKFRDHDSQMVYAILN